MNTPNKHIEFAESINFGVRDYLEGKFDKVLSNLGLVRAFNKICGDK